MKIRRFLLLERMAVNDIMGGMFGAIGVLAALCERDHTGLAQWVPCVERAQPEPPRRARQAAAGAHPSNSLALLRHLWRAPRTRGSAALGIRVGRKRVPRLMREAGLRGACRPRFICTTHRAARARPAADLVQRHFRAEAPNQLWVADATYIPTKAGFYYLAVVLDVYRRRIVGWAMDSHLRTALMLQALDMALEQRHLTSVIHHSDQGCQGGFNRSSQHL